MAGPLSGYRILDLTTVLMGPAATQILADMGADVVKVETADGDVIRSVMPARNPGMGAAFLNSNRGKRSIVLDLKNPDGRAAFLKLVESADALVYSLRPGTMEGLDLGYDICRAAKPDLVYCGAYGFHEDGPYAGQPAYDDVIQSASGMAAIQAFTTGEPRYMPSVMADKIVGLTVVYSLSMALLHRERTGEGQRVDVPMFETMVQFNLIEHTAGMQFVPPEGAPGYVRMQSEHRRPYKTADGYVAALPYTKRHWQRFFDVVGIPEMIDDPRVTDSALRSRKVGELYAKVTPALATWKTADILQALRDADIPCGPMNRLEDLPEDPHIKATGFLKEVEHPTEGTLLQADVPIRFSASPPSPGGPAPRLGEHSVDVLIEAGFDQASVEALIASGAIIDGR